MKSVIARHSVKLADGDAAYRVAAWQEMMSTSGDVQVTARQAERFEADCCWRRLGPAMIGRLQVTDCRLFRSEESVKTIGLDNVFINVIEAGSFDGFCGQRRMQASAGAACFTLLSSPADYHLRDMTWTAIAVSRKLLEREIGPIARYDGRVFAPGSLQAVLLDAQIRAMLALPDHLPSAEAAVAGRICLAILSALFGTVRKASKAALVDELQLAKSVRSHIADHISDPDLGPASICKAFNMSRSRLYRVMRSGEDIASEIRRLRLAGAHREIAAPDSIDVPIGLIAQRRGFEQDRTFRRAFSQAFGYSPTVLRARASSDRHPVLPASGFVIGDWFKDL